MKFSPEFIEKVLEANNLVDIISQYTVLKPAAGGYMGRCPFPDHQEKTPSFSVSEAKQVYHCFGCHKKGNLFTFLQQYSGQSFPEAVEYLAERARIPLPTFEDDEKSKAYFQSREKKKALFEVNRLAHQLFRHQLKKAPGTVYDYLKKRGLTEEIVDTFEIGFANETWDSLARELEKKASVGNFPAIPLAVEGRLIKSRKEGSGHFDIFRDRLMFPIHLPTGEIVGFGGRIVHTGEPKYLNSPETPVFTKGKILYGLYQTAKHIRSEDSALIVEGYMDLISLFKSGFKNVVASMGTAVTLDQALAIKKLTKNVVALFDGDFAGQEAAERSLPLFLQAGLIPKGIILPDSMDPDDFLQRHGAGALRGLIDQAQDLLLLVLDRKLEKFTGSPSEKIQICDWLRPIFEIISSDPLKQLYISELASRLQSPESWIKQTLGYGKEKGSVRENELQKPSYRPQEKVISKVSPSLPVPEKGKVSLKGASQTEIELVRLALKSRANFSYVISEKMIELVTHPTLKRVLERARDLYGQDLEKFDKLPSLLIQYLEEPELLFSDSAPSLHHLDFVDESGGEKMSSGGKFGDSFSEGSKSDDPQDIDEKEWQLMKDVFKKLKESNLKNQIRMIQDELKKNPSPDYIQKLQEIQKQINQLKHGV